MDNQTDVNTQTETQTDAGSSPSEQTPAADAAQSQPTTENSATTADTTAGDKTVPYDRFKEVNDSFRQTQQELKALREQQAQLNQNFTQQQIANNPQLAEQQAAQAQLEKMLEQSAEKLGFVRKADIEQQNAINAVRLEHNRLAEKYNGKDGLPKYDAQAVNDYALQLGMQNAKGLEAAYKLMHDAEITNARIQKAMQQSRGVQSETSNGTGSGNVGVSNDDLKKAAQEGDQNAVHILLKRAAFNK